MSQRLKVYAAPAIVVTFDPTICIHTGGCVGGLPAVFDVSCKRWVRSERATPETVAAQVMCCPSGVLQYQWRGRRAETAATDDPATPPSGP